MNLSGWDPENWLDERRDPDDDDVEVNWGMIISLGICFLLWAVIVVGVFFIVKGA